MTINSATPAEILALPIHPKHVKAETIGDYLIALLAKLWEDPWGFTGKYAGGDDDWNWELYEPLIQAGLVEPSRDEAGPKDLPAADKLIADAIQHLRTAFTPATSGHRPRLGESRWRSVDRYILELESEVKQLKADREGSSRA